MPPDPISVLVLYVHPLLGEGLARLLNAESGLTVAAVDIALDADIDRALAEGPEVLILEEGGAVRLEQLLARTRCSVLVDVSLNSGEAWILRREALRTRPDDLVMAIAEACLGGSKSIQPPVTTRRPVCRAAASARA